MMMAYLYNFLRNDVSALMATGSANSSMRACCVAIKASMSLARPTAAKTRLRNFWLSVRVVPVSSAVAPLFCTPSAKSDGNGHRRCVRCLASVTLLSGMKHGTVQLLLECLPTSLCSSAALLSRLCLRGARTCIYSTNFTGTSSSRKASSTAFRITPRRSRCSSLIG